MLIVKGLLGGLLQVALFAAMLLIPAGTWQWSRAIQFLVGYGVLVSVSIVVLGLVAPASLEARLEAPAAKSQPVADRVATVALFGAIIGWSVFIPLDVFRWHLLPPPSLSVSVVGVITILTGWGVMMAALVHNAFATPIVRDQSDRGQVLIDTGLYARVRHPFYLGLLVMFVGMALWLESYAGVLALSVVLAALWGRVTVEERTLRELLPGYADYITRVRHRVIPYVW